MARYTGPRTRIARKFGEAIFGADKVLSKKNYPPGQHGNSRKRKTSEYGIQLREKQKQNTLMAYWRSNLETYSKKLHALKVLPVRCFFNC